MPTLPTSPIRATERIEALCAAGLPAQELIGEVADAITAVVPADALFFAATDPETMLCIGPGVVRDMPDTVCEPFWELEFEVPDYNKFEDLSRGPRHVGELHAATGGRPQRSARWREFNQLMDADAELRASFVSGGRTWGLLHANRAGGGARFTDEELEFVERVAPLVGRGLRGSLVSQPAATAAGRGPGMAIVGADGGLRSMTTEAAGWFDEIGSLRRLHDAGAGTDVPSEVVVTVMRARAAGRASCRVRTKAGTWLLIHASSLTGTGDTAVIVEPAKASEVAPLIVEAYELTAREVEVTRRLARGLTTNEIAAELHLSRHTVADHLKAVYEKVGVCSRGELVAKMFADHYSDNLHVGLDRAAA